MTAQEGSSNCELCGAQQAMVLCACTSPPALLCDDCLVLHQVKNRQVPHQVLPIIALDYGPDEYVSKYNTVALGTAELRRSVELMEQYCAEVSASVDAAIETLTDFRDSLVSKAQAEKEQTSAAVEAAVEEAEACLAQGSQPTSRLAQALWTASPESLRAFSYSINPPDLKASCKTWASSQNTFNQICSRFKVQSLSPPEEAKTAPSEAEPVEERPPPPSRVQPQPRSLAIVEKTQVKLFNFQRKGWDVAPLAATVDLDYGSRYAWVEMGLFCSGGNREGYAGWGGRPEAYLLTSGNEWAVTRLADMITARGCHGVWWHAASRAVMIFGGNRSSGSCKSSHSPWYDPPRYSLFSR